MRNRPPSLFTPRQVGLLLVAAAVPLVAIVVFLGGGAPHAARAAARSTGTTRLVAPAPDASDFTGQFVGVSNEAAREHGDPARIANAHCVEAATGRYMCVYSVSRPDRPSECHLMQARWTPESTSSFTVTLSGRTEHCGSLSEALKTLR